VSDDAAPASTPERPGAGALLRAARERQGLHIAALAAAIKVSPRKLDALENDRWDELPDAAFTRALAQTVCRTLKVDPREVLERLPAAPTVALEGHDSGLNAPFRSRGTREPAGAGMGTIKPIIWASAALMVAAVVVWLLPQGLFQRANPPQAGAASQPLPSAVEPAMPTLPAPSASAVGAAPAAAEPASAPALPASAAGAASGPSMLSAPSAVAAPLAAAPAVPAPSPAVAPAVAPAPSTAGPLRLRATASSWVEVRDGRGNVVFSRTLGAGEAVGLDGPRPLRVTIGHAAGTEVDFNGQRIDLAPRTRDNVARLELN
jgi:cytoskeleton protein RodZ